MPISVQLPGYARTESPIERLLGLVGGVQQIKQRWQQSDDDALTRKFKEEAAKREQSEFDRKQQGILLPGEALSHLDNFDRVAPTDPGAFPVKIKRGDLMEEWGLKARPKMDPMQAAVAAMGLKQKQAELDQGKRLPADKVLAVNEGNTIPAMLGDIKGTLDKNANAFGPVAGRLASWNPYNEQAQTIDAQMRTAAQAFGRYMEGGVLRKEDEEKYRKMFPAMSDTPEVAKNKLALVERMLAQKQNANVQALSDQGYSTAGVNQPLSAPPLPGTLTQGPAGAASALPSANASSAGPKAGQVEDGFMFMGGDPRDQKNWKKVR